MESSMSQDNGLLLLHKCWDIKCEAFTVNKCWNKAKRFLSKLWGFHNVSNYVWQDVISVCLRHFMEHEVKDMNWSALSALQHLNASLNVLKKTFQYVGLLSHIFTHHKIMLFAKSIILGSSLGQSSHQPEWASSQIMTEVWENIFLRESKGVSHTAEGYSSLIFTSYVWNSFKRTSSLLLAKDSGEINLGTNSK